MSNDEMTRHPTTLATILARYGLTPGKETAEQRRERLAGEVAELRQRCDAGHCVPRPVSVAPGQVSCEGQVPMLRDAPGGPALVYRPCARAMQRAEDRRTAALLNGEAIPRDLQKQTLATFRLVAGTEEAVDAARSRAEGQTRWGLVLYGPSGRGKSHLSVAILLARHAAGETVAWRTWPNLLGLLRDANAPGRAGPEPLLHHLERVDWLGLDDIGQERESPYGHECMFRLLTARGGLSTIITTNVEDPAELAERFGGGMRGDAIVSRLRGSALWVPVDTDQDYRLVLAREREAAERAQQEQARRRLMLVPGRRP